MHTSERDRCIIQWRILALQFSHGGHEHSPKSAPQHAPVVKHNSELEDLVGKRLATMGRMKYRP